MADDCEDTGHHAPHLRNWRPTRTRLEESRATRRDALEERLQGHRHHTRANACDPSFTALTSSLYAGARVRSEEHTSELQSRLHLVCRLLLEKKKTPKHVAIFITQ